MPKQKRARRFPVAGVVLALAILPSVAAAADTCVSLLAAMPHRDGTVDVRLQNLCDYEINVVHCQSTGDGNYACPSFDRLPARQIGTFLFELFPRFQLGHKPPASYLSWCKGDHCERELGDKFRQSDGDPKALGDFIPLADGQGNTLTTH
jgi:hypothetical protein